MALPKIFNYSQSHNFLKLQNKSALTKTEIKSEEKPLIDDRWTKVFLHSIEQQRFLIFKDDFKLDDLTTEDLEKFKTFATNWLVENIIFFNLLEQVDINYDNYKIVKKLELIGFRKKLNSTLELFFNFKSKEDKKQKKHLVLVTFEIFNEKKDKFVTFFQKQLESKVLRYREINFINETYNISQWNKTRVDFFWKISYWLFCFKEIFDEIFKKINDEFLTKITISDNFSFFSWSWTDGHEKIKLTFFYSRFDIEMNINFKFTSYNDSRFDENYSTNFEKTYIERTLNFAKTNLKEIDYDYEIQDEIFFNLDSIDRYLFVYSFINNLSTSIQNVWDFYLPVLDLNARIRTYKNDLEFNKFILNNFSQSGSFDVNINFSTIQNNSFKRVVRIKWQKEKEKNGTKKI